MRFVFLVVDAHEIERDHTAGLLARLVPAAEVLAADSGEAALALLEGRRVVPSLAFLEQSLPGINGLEFMSEIRNRRWLERMPIVMLSNSSSDRLVVSAYRLRACAFLTKSARVFELRECIRDYAQPAVRMASGTLVSAVSGHAHTTTAA
jgi:DNA-binding NarL/FixJ family response regulator